MQELKPQLDKVPVTLSGKTHQQMQRWVGKALSRSKILAESEGVSPREPASNPSSAATVTARGDQVAQLGQHPHGEVCQAGHSVILLSSQRRVTQPRGGVRGTFTRTPASRPHRQVAKDKGERETITDGSGRGGLHNTLGKAGDVSPGCGGRLTLSSAPGDRAQGTLPCLCDSSINLRLLQINPKGKREADRLSSLAV